jgi:hypothetical protein
MAPTNGSGRQPDLHLVVRHPLSPIPKATEILTKHQTEDDFLYEQDIVRDPGNTKPWLAYIAAKLQHGNVQTQAFVMERACLLLPRSYKLWKMVRLDHLPSRGDRGRESLTLLNNTVPQLPSKTRLEAQRRHIRCRVPQG